MKHRGKQTISEKINLFRAGQPVKSLLGAFGSALKETRLTTTLGWLISRNPEVFREVFGIAGPISSVSVEKYQEANRTDIEIVANGRIHVIEAKRGKTDPRRQANEYRAARKIFLTGYIPLKSQMGRKKTRYVSWEDLSKTLNKLSSQRRGEGKTVSNDLLSYLKEHRMITEKPTPEIYAREINNEETLSLFLKSRIYCCEFEKHSRLGHTRYFAPHFGKRIGKKHPGIEHGISYVARIKLVVPVDSWKEFTGAVRRQNGKVFLKNNLDKMKFIRKWEWKNVRRNIVFLEEPHLVFNPPVKKDKIQSGVGWLSKNYLTFDDLFKGWKSTS